METISVEDALELQGLASDRPTQFIRDYMGADPWKAKQEEIIESVWQNKRTSVRSCHGSGKSWVSARIVPTWLLAWDDAIVVTTAPTWNQVKNVIWREVRSAYHQSTYPIGGQLFKERLEISDDWYAIGLSARDSNKFQGYHSAHILVIVDEAAGVSEEIFTAIKGLISAEGNRLLLIGNPTSLSGEFYKSHRSERYNKIHISVFDLPNFKASGIRNLDDLKNDSKIANQVITHPALSSPSWAREALEDWGEDSPMFESRVLGQFPSQGDNTLIPLNKIENAMTEERWDEAEEGTASKFGVDVARFGLDKTAIAERNGMKVYGVETWPKTSVTQTAGLVRQILDLPGAKFMIDLPGMGYGVHDDIKFDKKLVAEKRRKVVGVDVSEVANEQEKFANLRSELYWNLRDDIVNDNLALPLKDEELMAQLANIQWGVDRKGRIAVESKDEIKKRSGGKSPDKADALMLTYATRDSGGSEEAITGTNMGQMMSDESSLTDDD